MSKHPSFQSSPLLSSPHDDQGTQLLTPITAGFPSPATGHTEDGIDVDALLIRNRPATFLMLVGGDSMTGAGIFNRDKIVVDRSITAAPGMVVVAAVDGELTIRRLVQDGNRKLLAAEHPAFTPIDITGRDDVEFWGVVTYGLRKLY